MQVDVHDERPVDLGYPAILYDLDGSKAKLPGTQKNPSPWEASLNLTLTGMQGGSTEFILGHFFSNLNFSRLSQPVELPPLINFGEFYNAISQKN